MKTVASIAFLVLVAPIFAVPFEQLEARKYSDEDTSTSTLFRTKTSFFPLPTTQVPYIRPFESLIPSELTTAPSATKTHGAPHHTSASENDEHKYTRSGYPFQSGSGAAHHTHHTRSSFTVHPTGKPWAWDQNLFMDSQCRY